MDNLNIFNHECTDCPLHKTARTVCVEGRGNFYGEVLFVGEAPGEKEDEEGSVFVGDTGELFDYAMQDAGLSPEIGYITNVVNCRPPGNRDPEKDEILACRQYLEKIVELMPNLKLVVVLGAVAKSAFGLKKAITKIAGTPQVGTMGTRQVNCLPNVHPAYLFRNPEWDDRFINILKGIPTLLTGVEAGFVNVYSKKAGKVVLRNISKSKETKPKAFDLETTGLDPRKGSILRVSFCYTKQKKPTSVAIDTPEMLYWLREFYKSPCAKVCQNIAFEYMWGRNFLGVEMENPHADTMIMSKREDTSRLADLATIAATHVPESAGLKLDSQTAKEQGEDWWSLDPQVLGTRNALDSYATFKAFLRMSAILGKAQMKDHVERDIPTALFVSRIRDNGMCVDVKRLMELEKVILEERREAVEEAKERGIDCNLGSSQQVGEALKKVKIITGVLSKNRKYQLSNEDVLLNLITKFPHIRPIVQPVLDYRGTVKDHGTYVKGILTRVRRDHLQGGVFLGRGELRWPGTESFRVACSGFPLLTSPKGRIRTIYVSRWKGGWILKADYSQLELRVLAALSKDPKMLEIYENDLDIHHNTFLKIFGDIPDPDGSLRSKAKAVNFGIVYGGGPVMLQRQLRTYGIFVSLDECKKWIELFEEEYPVAMQFMAGLQAEAVMNLEIWSPAYNIKRTFWKAKGKKDKDIAKEGANHPIQCPAAQVALDGGRIFEEDLDPEDCLVVNLPHDEIVADCRTKQVLRAQGVRLRDSMLAAASMQDWFDVPVKVDVEYGKSWGDLQPFVF